ncbi:hypothetical protein [Nitrosococcus wardiae]|uniref:DUF1819 family protein n=1 Tax=Nitrosococcus wardiae TaxID=1814290 RepID=A0A4P7BVZ5_9GAMM|nr:hypothetical protein [Nitrosococcus wardiae]QBQ53359.1 hypothetical protein E3U44_01685 [Nitrosococcus wardiae]
MGVISDLNFETGIAGLSPIQALAWGFRLGERGTHTSRTIMLKELSDLLEAVPGEVSRKDYADAIMEANCLGKRTAATRKLSLQRLSELYGLDGRVILFRVLRDLWGRFETSRPLLALLLALARDPLLRATTRAVVGTPYGHEFARQPMKDALSDAVGERLSEATLDKVIRNASSSWTQSGHLRGRGRKTRRCVVATPAATAYALLLGFAVGQRGRLLFETPWTVVLDAGPDELIDAAVDAKQLGLLNLKQSGSMIDVSFPTILTEKERELLHGTHREAS